MNESDINICTVYGGLVITFINAWQLDSCSASSRFMHIDPGPVKASEVIYYSNHELKRIMSLKIKTLETFNGI